MADVVEGALIVENVQADSTVKIQLPIQGLLQDTAIDVGRIGCREEAKLTRCR